LISQQRVLLFLADSTLFFKFLNRTSYVTPHYPTSATGHTHAGIPWLARSYRYITSTRTTVALRHQSLRFSTYLTLPPVLLFYQSVQRYATRPAHNSLVYSVQHVFRRIGGRSAAHTNIHPKQSPASHAFNCSAHVTPLPWRPRSKKEYCRANSSSFRIGVLSICYTHPYAYTSFKMAQSPVVDHTRRHGGTHVRIFSHLRIPLPATPTSGSFPASPPRL